MRAHILFVRRVSRMLQTLNHIEHPKMLPYLVFTDDMLDWPGYEAHNQAHASLAQLSGMMPKIYQLDPNDDGADE
jgi:hypothetical protein